MIIKPFEVQAVESGDVKRSMIHNISKKPAVLVAFPSMKNRNTGFYHFGKSLGTALLKYNTQFNLSYYLPKNAFGDFIGKVDIVEASPFHQLFFAPAKRFQLVHHTDQLCQLKPNKVRGKKILTIHDLNFLHQTPDNAPRIKKYLGRIGRNIHACDQIVTISNFVKEEVMAYFPEAAHKIQVIYNGADQLKVSTFHDPNYRPNKPFIFTIGMVCAKKNFHVLPALLADNDFELVIAGIDSDYRKKIIDEAGRFGCTNRVKLIGPISDADKAWYYQHCLAFAFPSIAEGFGLPVLEAMHFGKPVFLSNKTSLPEIGGNAAFYFDSFEPQAMQQAFGNGLQEFQKNNLQRKVMDHAAEFSWDRAAAQYLQLYGECLMEG